MYEWRAAVLTPGPDGDAALEARLDPGDLAVQTRTVDPRDLGLPVARLADLLGGDAATNASLARLVLAGEPGPRRDVVLLNAAAGLVAAGVSGDLADGLVTRVALIQGGRLVCDEPAAAGLRDRYRDVIGR